MIERSALQRMLAEAVGTYGLVFAGTGTVTINAETDGALTHVGIGLTFGLAVMAMIYAVGHISGAHINPAVTLAFAAARHFPLRLVPLYLVAQLAGAVLASPSLRRMFGEAGLLGTTLPRGSDGQSFVMEIVLTC